MSTIRVIVFLLGLLATAMPASAASKRVAFILTATFDGGSQWQGAKPFGLNYWGPISTVQTQTQMLRDWIAAISFGKETISRLDIYGKKNSSGQIVDYYLVSGRSVGFSGADAGNLAAPDGYVASNYDVTIFTQPFLQDFSYGGPTIMIDGWNHLWLHYLRALGLIDGTLGNPFVPTGLAVYATTTHPDARQKLQLGWFALSQRLGLNTTDQGTYTLTPVETATGLKQLFVVQSDNSFVTVELRQPDQWEDRRTAGLVFMNPGSSLNGGIIDTSPEGGDAWDVTVGLGQKYYNAPRRMLYEFLALNAGAATVRVTRNADPPVTDGICQQGLTVTSADGAIWTLGDLDHDVRPIFRSGMLVPGDGKQLLTRDGVTYIEGLEQHWYRFTGFGWTEVPTPVSCRTAPPSPPR